MNSQPAGTKVWANLNWGSHGAEQAEQDKAKDEAKHDGGTG